VKIYNELADWFHLLSPPKDYADEAADYVRLIDSACPSARTLLELGSGGGNNASYLKHRFDCTLTDLSPRMLELSRSINPECEHIVGDMRTLRLGRQFDAVFVHDAVEYMTTPDDFAQVASVAFAHTRPGGVALFVPDGTAETFVARVDDGGEDAADGRAMRWLVWTFDPDPSDGVYEVHFACLVRDKGGHVRVVHDRHVHGMFTRQLWVDVLEGAGFAVTSPLLDPLIHEGQVAFLAVRPA
jgi:trans-aconitate methyltransferase